MTRKSTKGPSYGILGALALVAFVGAAAVAFIVTGGLRHAPQPEKKPSAVKPPVVTEVTQQQTVTLFLPKRSRKGPYLAPVTRSVAPGGNLLDAALTSLLAAGKEGREAEGLIPEGTRLLSTIKVTGGVAVVNLSKEFLENFSGGSEQEALTLNAIVHTLVHNSEGKVKRAQILVEGEPAESLGGHFDLSEPIAADSTLLRPDKGN